MNELSKDSALLRECYKSSRDVKEKERYHALYLYSMDYPKREIAAIFCRDEDTIKLWVDKWLTAHSVSDEPKDGRPAKIEDKDKERIGELTEENNPKKHGINASAWDCKELQKYFFIMGKRLSMETLRLCLKNMGAGYVKAQMSYPEADEKQREEFAKTFLNEMKTKPNSVVVLFQDEMSVCCSPRKGYGWTFEERLVVKAPQRGGRKRLNCFGAVNPLKGELTQMTSSRSKDVDFIRFLRKIEDKYQKKRVWIYLDNIWVHKSSRVARYLKKHEKMKLKFIPPYSPELNPQEHWWNHQRKKFLNNHYFVSKHQLATSLGAFVRCTSPDDIASICSLAPIENLVR